MFWSFRLLEYLVIIKENLLVLHESIFFFLEGGVKEFARII